MFATSVLETHYGKCWRDMYPLEVDLEFILKQIKPCQSLVSFSKVLTDNDRLSLTLNTRYRNHRRKTAYLDIISGRPCIDQFIDAAYGPGAKCDHGLILFDTPLCSDDKLIPEYIERSSFCGMHIHLIQIEDLGPLIYYKKVGPKRFYREISSQLPLRIDILKQDFWDSYYECWSNFESDGLFVDCDWDNEGLAFNIKEKSRNGLLGLLWKNKDEFIFKENIEKYPDIKFMLEDSQIKIKLDNIPVDALIKMNRKARDDHESYVREAHLFIEDKLAEIIKNNH